MLTSNSSVDASNSSLERRITVAHKNNIEYGGLEIRKSNILCMAFKSCNECENQVIIHGSAKVGRSLLSIRESIKIIFDP